MSKFCVFENRKKLSQKEVADFLGVSRVNYCRYENGTRMIPVDLLVKLADFYDVSLDFIVGRVEIEKK